MKQLYIVKKQLFENNFMSKIDTNILMSERIKKFNQFVMSLDINRIPIGLSSGKMGICIYFYQQARLTRDKAYQEFAEALFNSICNQVQFETSINMEKGLVGISSGIDYLITEKYIPNNVNKIMPIIDGRILKIINANTELQSGTITESEIVKPSINASMYFCKRLKNNNLHPNERFLTENYIVETINRIECVVLDKIFEEPYMFTLTNYFLPSYLFLLSNAYELKFFNYKIIRLLNDLTDKLISTYPLLQSNRLFLSAAMRSIEKQESLTGWKEHILFLDQSVDIDTCLMNEFRNKSIFPNDGITGLYYLISRIHQHKNIDLNLIREKIILSDAWDDYMKDESTLKTCIGLVTGFCGVVLTYQELTSRR